MKKAQLLRESSVEPTSGVIANALGKIYPIYVKFINGIKNDIVVKWHYYNDGKAWLGKAQANKKTVFWLSVWEGFFMLSFYFTEKTKGAIQNLEIGDGIKERMANATAIGKLIPLTFKINEENQLQDLFSVINYKKNLK